jgi:hypothetical protein
MRIPEKNDCCDPWVQKSAALIWFVLILQGVIVLFSPEGRRKKHNQCKYFQSSQQHGCCTNPGLEIAQTLVIGSRTYLIQTRTSVIDAGDDGAKR